MAALLRGGSRRGYRLLHIRRNGPCSQVCWHDTHEGTSKHVFAAHGHTDFRFLSSEATSNVNDIRIRAPMGFSFKPTGYERPIVENSVHSTLCTVHVAKSLHKTISEDGVSFHGSLLTISKHWSHSKCFHTSEPASVIGSKLEMKRYGDTLFGFGGRKSISWTGWRFFSSINDFNSAVLSMATDQAEAEIEPTSAENVEDFDFTNFPALKSSFFENYERPSEMLVPKKRLTWRNEAKSFGADKKLTVDSIPKPRGRTYDFGLGNFADKPPSLEAGARPQGGFDIDISSNNLEVDTCENSALLHRQSCLPSKIFLTNSSLESKKDSHVGEVLNSHTIKDRDLHIHEDRDFQTTEDRVLDYEQDLLWDPYNVGDD